MHCATQFTPFKTIWPDFYIVYTIDSFQDHLTWFYHCVPTWLLSRPYNLILSIVYPIDSFQDHLTQFFIIVMDPIDSFQDHLT